MCLIDIVNVVEEIKIKLEVLRDSVFVFLTIREEEY